MPELAYRMHDGHILAELEGDVVLLDTGAPRSIGRRESWTFLGEPVQIASGSLGLDVDSLSELVGTRIDVLLGADLLTPHVLQIDPALGVLRFGGALEGARREMELVMGIPRTEIGIGGGEHTVFFDTGARLSYSFGELDAFPRTREANFYPGFSRFSTLLHRVPVEIDGVVAELEFGVLPPLLAITLRLAGADAILGSAILDHFGVVLDYPARRIGFPPR